MSRSLRLNAVAFISPQNHPILVRTFSQSKQDELKYHYIAHTSLDVIDERVSQNAKGSESYLGLLYTMEDVAVYGYTTPLKMKIILAVSLSDTVVRDADVSKIFRALHMAYYGSLANPFLTLKAPPESSTDHALFFKAGSLGWTAFRRRVDSIGRAVGMGVPTSSHIKP